MKPRGSRGAGGARRDRDRGRRTRRAWGLYRAAVADLEMIMERDPSMRSRTEALLHPALVAIWGYRVAHPLHRRGLRRTARLLSVVTRLASGGIEIHPGARIGHNFFIDHGAGVVIGETAVIGDGVTIFHQVTLGSVGWWHDRRRPDGARRHPEVGDRVVIGAGATLLGPITVGPDTVIGAQALVIDDVPGRSRVLAPVARAQRRPVRPTAGRAAPALASAAATGIAVPGIAVRGRDDARVGSVPFPAW